MKGQCWAQSEWPTYAGQATQNPQSTVNWLLHLITIWNSAVELNSKIDYYSSMGSSSRLLGHREPQKTVEDPQGFSLEHRDLEKSIITQWVTNHLILLVLNEEQSPKEKRQTPLRRPGLQEAQENRRYLTLRWVIILKWGQWSSFYTELLKGIAEENGKPTMGVAHTSRHQGL